MSKNMFIRPVHGHVNDMMIMFLPELILSGFDGICFPLLPELAKVPVGGRLDHAGIRPMD
jgi:hypothetical protein